MVPSPSSTKARQAWSRKLAQRYICEKLLGRLSSPLCHRFRSRLVFPIHSRRGFVTASSQPHLGLLTMVIARRPDPPGAFVMFYLGDGEVPSSLPYTRFRMRRFTCS